MQKRCAPADIFALGFRIKFMQNDLVLEGVDVWTSKTFGKAEENINLPFLRSLNAILLLHMKQSQFFCFSCFAYLGVSAKPRLGES